MTPDTNQSPQPFGPDRASVLPSHFGATTFSRVWNGRRSAGIGARALIRRRRA